MATKGQIIHELRKKRKLTLQELADAVGTSRQTIHRYEKDEITTIPGEKVERLAAALGTTPSVILGWATDSGAEATSCDIVYDTRYTVKDECMAAHGIHAGDTLLIKLTDRISGGKLHLVSRRGESVICKIFANNDNIIVQDGEMPEVFPIEGSSELEIIGVAIANIFAQ